MMRITVSIEPDLARTHSIRAAIEVRPKAVKRLRVQSENPGEPWDDVIQMARKHGVPISVGAAETRGPRRETERIGAGSAMVEPPSPVPLELLLQTESSSGLWLALDQIQDPQNLGAIFRLAGFFGVRGIVMCKDRSASVNATVV